MQTTASVSPHVAELFAEMWNWMGFRYGRESMSDKWSPVMFRCSELAQEWQLIYQPAALVREVVLLMAQARGETPRQAWTLIRREAYRDAMRLEGGSRVARLIVAALRD